MSHTPSQITEIMQIIILIFITTMIEVFSIMSTIVQNINSLIISAIIINTLISPKIISGLIRTFLITKDMLSIQIKPAVMSIRQLTNKEIKHEQNQQTKRIIC